MQATRWDFIKGSAVSRIPTAIDNEQRIIVTLVLLELDVESALNFAEFESSTQRWTFKVKVKKRVSAFSSIASPFSSCATSYTFNERSSWSMSGLAHVFLVLGQDSRPAYARLHHSGAPATATSPMANLLPSRSISNIPSLHFITLHGINSRHILKLYHLQNFYDCYSRKMGLFKHKEKAARPDLLNPTNATTPQPSHSHNNSYHDSTYYSSSNVSTADSNSNTNSKPAPAPSQVQAQGQPPGTTVTTTTTTTTSKSSTYHEYEQKLTQIKLQRLWGQMAKLLPLLTHTTQVPILLSKHPKPP